MALDWHELYFGHVSPQEVQEAVKDPAWQDWRKSMKGQSLEKKHEMLLKYKMGMRLLIDSEDEHAWRMVEVRLTNYVTALSRGGLIKPEDYR